MLKLNSFVSGAWHSGGVPQATLLNPATEESIAESSTEGIDFAAALEHARAVGGPALRAMTFAERAQKLQGVYDALFAKREEFIELSVANGGNTRNDAKFDVDGATATLLAYVDIGREIGDRHVIGDGVTGQISRTPRYGGKHIYSSMRVLPPFATGSRC